MSPAAFTPDPAAGRVFTTARSVRSTDVTPSARLRVDAIARYLHDAAEDDIADIAAAGTDVLQARAVWVATVAGRTAPLSEEFRAV